MDRLQDTASLFSQISAGQSIVVHSGFSTPMQLAAMLAENAEQLQGVNIHTLMPMARPDFAEPEPAAKLKINSFFPGVGLRRAFNEGSVNALPYPLSQIPSLFAGKELGADMLLLQVSLPDAEGNVSLGVSVDYMQAVIARKPVIVAEVSPQVPNTCGDTKLPVSAIDWFIDANNGPLIVTPSQADEVDQQIAANVAGLVDDGAVLQVGIGSLPDQVLAKLVHARNLGVHSGIITDAMRPLIESGVINNSTKKQFAGVSVTTMVGGTQAFYDFLHENPAVELHPCSLTHNADMLASINGLTAINSALQVDLSGCANAESVNGKVVAMPGGLPDFAKGASLAENGKSIIAMRSSFNQGKSSNIIVKTGESDPITLTSDTIDYVVTEYGVAPISSVSATKRAMSLIEVAHPNFREGLMREFYEMDSSNYP